MGDIRPPSPASTPSNKSNFNMLYYGLVVVGTAALVLAVYNLIIIKWCIHRQASRRGSRLQRPNRLVEVTSSQSFENPNRNLLSSFKYKKDINSTTDQGSGSEYECPVCLSVFEDGEDVRQLPRCKHSFHAACIDMWLYSHYDCPLCRSPVDSLFCHQNMGTNTPENSQQGLLDTGISV